MHEFHAYIAGQLENKLKKRSVVVLYDPRSEFLSFINELPRTSSDVLSVPQVKISETDTFLAQFHGSFLGLRLKVEPLAAVDRPAPLLVYVSGAAHNQKSSLLTELECAGEVYEPQLRRLARNILRQKYSEGQIDQMLARESLIYEDVVGYVQQSIAGQPASMLKTVFGHDSWVDILIEWIASDRRDSAIREKEAVVELYQLIESRVGLEIPPEVELTQARATTTRYVLVNEFRLAFTGTPPASISMIPRPPSKEHVKRVCEIADGLREQEPQEYVSLADRVEGDLGLSKAGVQAGDIGSTDTFRFEEKLLLARCAMLIAQKDYHRASDLIAERKSTFWLDHQLDRQAQWECCRLMTELGLQIRRVQPSLAKMSKNPRDWVEAYTEPDGWFQADLLHRKLEAWVANMEDEPEAVQGLGVVRREYEEFLKKMAGGFGEALRTGSWAVPGVLHQTQIYQQVVAPNRARTAYFLVDAMRYEMGSELASQLQGVRDLSLRPAVAALPTITEVCMAALLPGASASFSVVEHKGKLAAKIEGVCMPGLPERLKFLKAKVPDSTEITLDKVLSTSTAKLQRSINGSSLVLVRSQEIDALGEQGLDLLARQSMDSIVGNLARAVRKLAKLGVESFVITADHGYQYALRKDEDMRADSPGGNTVNIHRRCWAGHGGQTPPGSVRIAGADLGYETALEFIFPAGLEV
jgi:hypothetical protein